MKTTAYRAVLSAFSMAGCLALGGCQSEVGDNGALVGGSCVVSIECSTLSRCLTGDRWPGGYCATTCETSADCPDGSQCADSTDGNICVVTCAGPGDCRNDDDVTYACIEFPARAAAGNVMGCGFTP